MSKITLKNFDEIKDFKITFIDISGMLLRFKFKGEKYQLEQIDYFVKDNYLASDILLSRYNKDKNTYDQIDIKATHEDMKDMLLDVSTKRKPCLVSNVPSKYKRRILYCRRAEDSIQYSKLYNITYTNIDRIYLLKHLTDIDIIGGVFEDLIKLNRQEQFKFDEKIQKLKSEIGELEAKRRELESSSSRMGPSNHGSKIYTSDIKIKISDRDLDKAYKTGDYIEKYNAKIGDTHPEYGGVLTDLRGLKYGTVFRCTNGDWYGLISCNSHGNKTVGVIDLFDDTHKENLVTEENCCLYVEL